MLRAKNKDGVVTPGIIILNALVKEMKSAGVETISVKELEKVLNRK